MDCEGICEKCNDAECKAIKFHTMHKIRRTRELKFSMRKAFEAIEKGEFEDDDDDGI